MPPTPPAHPATTFRDRARGGTLTTAEIKARVAAMFADDPTAPRTRSARPRTVRKQGR